MSGPIEVAKQALRKEILREGLCVTIEPTLFLYTGGEEHGFVVGLLNYPKYPSSPIDLLQRARHIRDLLLAETAQESALIVTPTTTEWRSARAP